MRILVLNSGSSSLKFRLLEMATSDQRGGCAGQQRLLNGSVKGIGGKATLELHHQQHDVPPASRTIPDHSSAVQWLFEHLTQGEASTLSRSVDAVGHRIVHGGEKFSRSVLLDESIMIEIEALSELAPLHNPGCLAGIRGARKVFGSSVPMVGVFDTAFHRTLPPYAQSYALPFELAAKHHIKRYGFHGIAHASLVAGYEQYVQRPIGGERLITLQLGNGCSVTAVSQGQSIETSMGFTPLEGLMMGTRSGDLDPSIVSYLVEKEAVPASEVERWLNERSGLLGVSGRSNDMRELLRAVREEQDERASLAIDMFCYRARKYIGSYLAVLGGADALIFGGGIGEASPEIRARICAGMEWCGVTLDSDRNVSAVDLSPGRATCISQQQSELNVYVVAADEETMIAQETMRCLQEANLW